MSKLIFDGFQKPGGDEFTFPMTKRAGVLHSDANGNLSVEVETPDPKAAFSKLYALQDASVALVDVLWGDLNTGLALDDIAFVKMKGVGISGSAACQLRFYGLDAGGAPVTTGYMGCTISAKYASSSSRADNVSHNSNQGWWQFPMYQPASKTGYNYGEGNITFDALLRPHKGAAAPGNVACQFDGSYHQVTSYNSPNIEHLAWGPYENGAGISDLVSGFRMQPTSGTLDRGYLEVTAVLKEAV